MTLALWMMAAAGLLLACCSAPAAEYRAFARPVRVAISGYNGDAMEPFVTRDGRYLFFNNRNDPGVDTNLHYAERDDDTHFVCRGALGAVNTPALGGVPTMACDGTFYFVSPRNYASTLSTVYRGQFAGGAVSGVEVTPGISRATAGRARRICSSRAVAAEASSAPRIRTSCCAASIPRNWSMRPASRPMSGSFSSLGSARFVPTPSRGFGVPRGRGSMSPSASLSG